MALINCKECGKEISKQAKVCPNCGYKNKKSAFSLIILIFFALIIYSSTKSGNEVAKNAERLASAPSSITNTTEPIIFVWSYNSSQDGMGRGEIKNASIISKNEVSFSFPYTGSQNATLILRKHPKYGNDVILTIERGQFLCGYDGCNVNVKFDDGKAETFSASEPEDNSTNVLFIKNFDRFLSKVKNSKITKIEAKFYQEGTRVFEFNTANLKW